MSSRIAIILGVGPGLSASIARSLAPTHNLVLLSRSLPDSFPKLNLDLPSSSYLAASSDGSRSSLDKAISEAQTKWPKAQIDVGVFNTGGGFSPGSFLDQTEQTLRDNLDKHVIAAFNFGQAIIPLMLENEPNEKTGGKGSLIFTGATMAMRGGAIFSSMSPGMFARRSLTQSLAREFGPKGVHVAHVVVDGQIDAENGGNEKASTLPNYPYSHTLTCRSWTRQQSPRLTSPSSTSTDQLGRKSST